MEDAFIALIHRFDDTSQRTNTLTDAVVHAGKTIRPITV